MMRQRIFYRKKLQAQAVSHQFERRCELATITKLRIISRHQQLIRADFEEAITTNATEVLLKRFSVLLENYAIVVFIRLWQRNLS